MSENNEKSITYIKNDKYLFNIIKIYPVSSTNIEKIGLTIYKKTLEINKLNKDCIDLLLANSSDFKESYANLGFINILGVLCFVYASDNDITEKLILKMDNKPSFRIYRIENFHCFILSSNISSELKKKVRLEFEKIGKFLINEELYFCNSPYKFDLDIPNQLNIFQDNFFKYKLIEKYQYNQGYYPKICEKIITPLVKGFYKRITYNNLFNEKDHVNVVIRYKIYGQNKYLIEVEMFIISNNNQKIFENLFYVYFNESSDKIDFLAKVIDNWNNIVSLIKKKDSNIKSEGLMINLHSNILDDQNEDIKNNNFQEQLKNLTNFEFINLKNAKDSILEKELYNNNIDKLKSIGYNYKYNNIDYNSQNKLLILTGNDFDNLFSLIKIVAYLLYGIYLKSRGFQQSVIDNAKEEISKYFKHFEKKILKQNTQFTKKPNINIVENLEEFKNSIESEKNDIVNNDLMCTENKNDEKVVLVDPLDIIDNIDKINIDEEKKNIESCENKEDIYYIDEDNSKNINIDKIINDINKPQNVVNVIKDNNNSKAITLFIGTFNVNALDSDLIKTTNLAPFLFPEKLKEYFAQSNYPTFYAIGLEETIELNPKNILISPKNKVEIWEERISQELQEKYNYFLYNKDQLVGVLFLFFVKPSEIKYMNNKHMEKLKSGFMGCGNKGCCFLDFEYKGASYGFCSAHLPAGQKQKNFNDRKEVFRDILDFKVSGNEYEFYKNDFFFIFGDLNFRSQTIGLINLQNHIKMILGDSKYNQEGNKKKKNFRFSLDFYINKTKEKPKKKKMDRMCSENVFANKSKNIKTERSRNSYEKDKNKNKSKDKAKDDFDNNEVKEDAMDENIFLQYFFKDFLEEEELKNLKEKELFIYDVDESEISFPPTYKYVKGTNFYNLSKRVPSWTDRILFKKGGKIRTILYDRANIHFSDHKPIIGLFEIDIHE
jgi:hypothetical protein